MTTLHLTLAAGLAFALALSGDVAVAQSAPSTTASSQPLRSPEILGDGRVTFRLGAVKRKYR